MSKNNDTTLQNNNNLNNPAKALYLKMYYYLYFSYLFYKSFNGTKYIINPTLSVTSLYSTATLKFLNCYDIRIDDLGRVPPSIFLFDY